MMPPKKLLHDSPIYDMINARKEIYLLETCIMRKGECLLTYFIQRGDHAP